MLASLLPGLREIRAPLAAGYLWLVVAWLVFQDRVETGATASGSVDALLTLKDELGTGGLTAAATFVAYLVGALWQPIAEAIAKPLGNITATLWKYGRVSMYPSTLYRAVLSARSDLRRLSPGGSGQLRAVARRLFGDVDEQVRRRLSITDEMVHLEGLRYKDFCDQWNNVLDDVGTPLTAEGELDLELESYFESRQRLQTILKQDDLSWIIDEEFGNERDRWWIREADEIAQRLQLDEALYLEPYSYIAATKWRRDRSIQLVDEEGITDHLYLELPLTANRLVGGETHDLYLEVSRMKGEVEFRTAVAIPIAAVIGVVTFGLGLPFWLWLVCVVVGLAFCAALIVDGWRRDRDRNDFLVALLATKQARSPTFDRLLERAEVTSKEEEAVEQARAAAPQMPPSRAFPAA